ncbi:MAG: hypothetical protein AAF191_01800 [Verrucomicrobiota bacterium]
MREDKKSQMGMKLMAVVIGLFGALPEIQSADLDPYGGFADIRGEKTGFFHTQKIDGRWWLVTPDGHGFWGMGISHPVTGFSRSTITFAYQGDQEAWLKDSIKRMRALGYNCVWTGPYSPERLQRGFIDRALARKVYREANIPYAFPLPITRHSVEMAPGDKRPDVFGEEYGKFVVDLVDEFVPEIKDDPWVIGYYYGFAPWSVDFPWLNDLIERKGSAGRARLLGLLENRYGGDIGRFNVVYQTNYASFGELKESGSITFPEWPRRVKMGYGQIPAREGSQELYDDSQALLAEVIEHVAKIAYDAVRRHDQNHLILGWYVKDATYTEEMWERISPYIDVLTPQHVSKVFPIADMVEKLGKPALISDQPFGNVYPLPLVTARNAPGAVPDHLDRLVLYDLLSRRISSDPNFIGVDFCSVLFDQSHEDKAYEVGQPGMFTVYGEPKPLLNRTMIHYNHRMRGQSRQTLPEEELNLLDVQYHETLDRYRSVMRDRKTFLQQNPLIGN